MRLTALSLQNWRNTTHVQVETDARLVVLYGDNAQGKTNLLEAVWMLSTLRSFRESKPERLVRHGEENARLVATVTGDSGRRTLGWNRVGANRELTIDDARANDVAEWFSVLRAVLFCPEHASIVRGGPVERRSFVDRAAFTLTPAHLDLVRDYGRVLRHKAALLRTGRAGRAEMGPWNVQLAALGARLAARRADALRALSGPFQAAHDAIAGTRAGRATLRMVGVGRAGPGETIVETTLQTALQERLEAAFDEERRQSRSLVGPHRDDLVIELDGQPARAFASQGQTRSIVLALKLAELNAARAIGVSPLFLLDDLTSELDRGRMGRLMEVLSGLDNQVWVTTTDPRWLGPLAAGGSVALRVRGGQTSLGRVQDAVDESYQY